MCFHAETVNSLRVVVFVVPNKYQVSLISLEHKKDPAMLLWLAMALHSVSAHNLGTEF